MSRGTHAGRAAHTLRRSRWAAAIAGTGLIALTLIAFFGLGVFKHPYQLRGVFTSANELRVGSEVRVAGIKVGEVSGIAAGPGHTSIVTMDIDRRARPIHADAETAIAPRLILEGNFYIALRPGSPGAPDLASGASIPQAHTSVPVQLDQVLDTFDSATRGSLRRSIAKISRGLGPSPPGDPAPTPPGAVSLRSAVRELRDALPPARHVARALRGTQAGDLGHALRTGRDITTQLAADPRALADGITNFNRLTGALASQDQAVTMTVRELDRLMRAAPPGLRAVDRALPAVETFATALRPALAAAPRPLNRATAFVTQLEGLFGPGELPALLNELGPTFTALPSLEHDLGQFAPLDTRANQCLADRVAWTLDQKLQDGSNSTGDPVYLDAAHGYSGASGVVSGFDGNGAAIRIGITANETEINSIVPGLGRVVGQGIDAEGVRPTWLGYGIEPPYRPDQWCSDQPLPDLSARSGPPPRYPSNGSPMRIGGILP